MEERVKLFEVDENILQSVTQRFNRSENSINEDVETLKEWMRTQHHLPEVMDNNVLRNLLICNKFSIEKTKYGIDMYYTLRSKFPEVFMDSHPEKIWDVMDAVYFTVLPKCNENNYRVYFGKVRRPKKFRDDSMIQKLLKNSINILEIRLREDVIHGDVCIFDVKDLKLSVLKSLSPMTLLPFLRCAEEIFSVPMKEIYILNSHPYMKILFDIFKTFIKQKFLDRTHFYEDDKILLQLFPKEIIPRDYGGDEKSLEELNDLLKLKLQEYKEFFHSRESLKVNEELRPEPLQNDEFLGVYGNFKKLDID